jgi:hypothetical protein
MLLATAACRVAGLNAVRIAGLNAIRTFHPQSTVSRPHTLFIPPATNA